MPKIKPVKAWKPHGPIKARATNQSGYAWFYAERGTLTVCTRREENGPTAIAEIPWHLLRKHMPPVRVLPKRKKVSR